MPPIISFEHTWEALLAGGKTVTRRVWSQRRAAQINPGMICKAYDLSPRNEGQHIANIKITSVTLEPLASMTIDDYTHEGLALLHKLHPDRRFSIPPYGYSYKDFTVWQSSGSFAWTVRFELQDIVRCIWRNTGQCTPNPGSCIDCDIWRLEL